MRSVCSRKDRVCSRKDINCIQYIERHPTSGLRPRQFVYCLYVRSVCVRKVCSSFCVYKHAALIVDEGPVRVSVC